MTAHLLSDQDKRHLYATWQFKWFAAPPESKDWDTPQWIAYIDSINGWRPAEGHDMQITERLDVLAALVSRAQYAAAKGDDICPALKAIVDAAIRAQTAADPEREQRIDRDVEHAESNIQVD